MFDLIFIIIMLVYARASVTMTTYSTLSTLGCFNRPEVISVPQLHRIVYPVVRPASFFSVVRIVTLFSAVCVVVLGTHIIPWYIDLLIFLIVWRVSYLIGVRVAFGIYRELCRELVKHVDSRKKELYFGVESKKTNGELSNDLHILVANSKNKK